MTTACRIALAALLAHVPAALSGQSPLGPPQVLASREFSQVRGVRELADGRLLVTDWIDEALYLISADFRQVIPVGRRGSGPQEFRLPASLFPMAGDSTLLADVGNARLLVLTPAGTVARTIAADRPGLGSVAGVDDAGRLYYALAVWARGPSALPEDSVEVFRVQPATGVTERLTVVKGTTPPTNRGPRLTPGFSMVAFAPQDAWRVLPTGGLVVVRAGDYRVERITDRGLQAGPSHAYRTESVRPADRERFVRDFVARAPMSGRGPDGGMGHGPAMSDAQIRQMVETNEFAATLPPFERILLAADGELWVLRGRHQGAAAVYDRLDAAGRRIGQVSLPPEQEVVAVGRGHVFVVSRDDDGVETLARHPRPR